MLNITNSKRATIHLIGTFIVFSSLLSFGQHATISLEKISTYHTGSFDQSATEIVAHDVVTQRLFVTNGATGMIDILDISNPNDILLHSSIDLAPYGKSANSVAVNNGIVAVAVENVNKQSPGKAVFFDAHGTFISQVTAGALPDNIVFSPNGKYALVANEGEPNDDYTIDPEGSVTIVDLRDGVHNITQGNATQVSFVKFNNISLDPSIRVHANPGNSTVAQDLEPEYITVSKNSKLAWVALQENNAMAVIDVRKGEVIRLIGLGFKDHSLAGNGLDASDETVGVDISNWPIKGMYMPDAISNYKRRGKEYIVLANEGDSRDYTGYSEETRVKDLALDPIAFPNAALLQSEEAIGRMKTTIATGDANNDGLFEEIYTYGSRSFSIRRGSGKLIYDSGDEFEQITAQELPGDFNSTNDENGSFKDRSDDKGPEPEAVEIAKLKGRYYAFIGLERVGGIMVYDITNPYQPVFRQYINNRDFSVGADTEAAGDLGPEDILFIKRKNSPINSPIIASANEVSGTITLFKINTVDHAETALMANKAPVNVVEAASDDKIVEAINSDGAHKLIVFPNPISAGMLYLTHKMDILIFDQGGVKVYAAKSIDQLDVSFLKKGNYILKNEYGKIARLKVK
jgi:hypothetical protein